MAVASSVQAGESTAGSAYPPPLESYGDAGMTGVLDILLHRTITSDWARLFHFLGEVEGVFGIYLATLGSRREF